MADQWYYMQQGKRQGLVSAQQLKELAATGQLSPTDLVGKDGMAALVPASLIKGLFAPPVNDESPPIPPEVQPPPLPTADEPPPLPKTFLAHRGTKSSSIMPLALAAVIVMALVAIGAYIYMHSGNTGVAKSNLSGTRGPAPNNVVSEGGTGQESSEDGKRPVTEDDSSPAHSASAESQGNSGTGRETVKDYFKSGNDWMNSGEYDKAIAAYDKAIKLMPNNAYGYYDRGNVWSKKREYDKAIADFDQAINLKPRFSLAYLNRGAAKAKKNDFDGAIADFDQAIGINPKSSKAYNDRGLLKAKQEDYDGAIADFSKALRINPNYTNARRNLRVAKARSKDYDEDDSN